MAHAWPAWHCGRSLWHAGNRRLAARCCPVPCLQCTRPASWRRLGSLCCLMWCRLSTRRPLQHEQINSSAAAHPWFSAKPATCRCLDTNSFFSAPHVGHCQSAGRFCNGPIESATNKLPGRCKGPRFAAAEARQVGRPGPCRAGVHSTAAQPAARRLQIAAPGRQCPVPQRSQHLRSVSHQQRIVCAHKSSTWKVVPGATGYSGSPRLGLYS